MQEYRVSAGTKLQAKAPLRLDFVGMSDYFPARGINLNAAISGLSADLYAEFRDDDLVTVHAGEHGTYEMRLEEVYERDDHDQMFMKALKMYPGRRLVSGVDVYIDCQYGAGGLSTSSSVAAAIHAFLEYIFDVPSNPLDTVWRVVRTEPHSYGRQDQLAAVCGGINMWEMEPEEFSTAEMRPITFHPTRVRQHQIHLSPERLRQLNLSVMIYESGISEGAGGILRDVATNFLKDPTAQQSRFDSLNSLAVEMRDCLRSPARSTEQLAIELGTLLNRVRSAHASLHHDVMNTRMADLFESAEKAGATGGRINGAGRRGTIQLAVPPRLRAQVQHALNQVDTPGPTSRRKLRGELIEHGGFGAPGAHCFPV